MFFFFGFPEGCKVFGSGLWEWLGLGFRMSGFESSENLGKDRTFGFGAHSDGLGVIDICSPISIEVIFVINESPVLFNLPAFGLCHYDCRTAQN